MLQIHPETPLEPSCAGARIIDFAAIRDINREFLRVLISPAVRGRQQLLGLEAPVLEGLCSLSARQLDEVATTPQLLAEFGSVSNLAGSVAAVAEHSPTFANLDSGWEQEMHAFTDRLLTCLWQSARHDKLLAMFCIGPNDGIRQSMAQLSFTQLSRNSDNAYRNLRARLASHPRFWPDLIRAARNGSAAQRHASQLSIIQLSVATLLPGPLPESRVCNKRSFS